MATLTVGPTGTYPSIAAAMAAALPGDTIQLQPNYQGESATISVNNLTIAGDGTNTGFVLALSDTVVLFKWSPPTAVAVRGGAADNIIQVGSPAITHLGENIVDGGLGADNLDSWAGVTRFISGAGNTRENGFRTDALSTAIDTLVIDRSTATANLKIHIEVGQRGPFFPGGSSVIVVDVAGNWSATAVEKLEFTGGSGNDVIIGAGFEDILIGGAGQDNLNGSGGSDIIDGGAGDDFLEGSAGIDTVSYGTAAAAVQVQLLLQGIAQLTGGAGSDTLSGFENLSGSAFDDVLFGDNGANTITGGAGNDTIEGLGGSDILDGGDGRDTVSYQNTTGGNVAASLLGLSNGGAGNDTLLNFENIVGSVYHDVLFGNDFANELWGLDGDDTINGGLGNDDLRGGNGVDTAAYTYAASGVSVSLAAQGAAQSTIAAGVDTLTGFENLAGSAFNDVLTGDGGANLLAGGAGFDVLIGGGGADVLAGGAGADYFILNAAADSSTAAPDIITDFQTGVDSSTCAASCAPATASRSAPAAALPSSRSTSAITALSTAACSSSTPPPSRSPTSSSPPPPKAGCSAREPPINLRVRVLAAYPARQSRTPVPEPTPRERTPWPR